MYGVIRVLQGTCVMQGFIMIHLLFVGYWTYVKEQDRTILI